MTRIRRFTSSKTGRLALAGAVLLALSAPALADHLQLEDLEEGQEVTAEDLHVECPDPEEGQTEEEALEACDAAVQETVQELVDYDHPENHGKYVSFLAHCVPGGTDKGTAMRQIAQASEEEQAELAVKLCSESKFSSSSEDEEESFLPEVARGKGKGPGGEGEEDLEIESEHGGKGRGAEKSSKAKGRRGR